MSTIADLRAATWPSHQKLERRLDVKKRFSSLSAYRCHLERMWGFCAMLEALTEPWVRDALRDFESRRKLPLLTRDLIATGSDPNAVAKLPRMTPVPACRDTASGFGCLYVLEGATLGGRTLLPKVQRTLGLAPTHGAEFLASYGERVTLMWRTFGSALDAWCVDPARSARARTAAVATFDALADWLCGRAA
jgi:heme oxygenase (biliverdin-IX-beta and delta-forming)